LFSLVLLSVLGLPACATDSTQDPPAASSEGVNPTQLDSQQRLQEIAAKREHDSFSIDFGIGPGDVLEISVPDVDEGKEREERISPQGIIELPIAGSLQVSGLSEPQLHDALTKAYSKYIKDPQVDVFVKSYSSRQVAVVGMVNKPGLYTLNRRNETILDLIGEAGGMSDGAGSSIVFVPTSGSQSAVALNKTFASLQSSEKPPSDDSSGATVAVAAQQRVQINAEEPDTKAAANWQASSSAVPGTLAPGSNSIFINVTGGNQSQLAVAVRPGDLIMVPARGQVLVKGWVDKPGAYPITPGMTALGAVAAAGGEMFSSSAMVLRASGGGGAKIQLPVNLSDVASGQASDVQVQSGDIVIVERSVVGAVPYLVYFLAQHFGAGMSLGAI
jgi:polysaccharide export outer membrane protein